MSTKTGTATDYVDLIEQLDAFLVGTGHAWGKAYAGTGNGDLTNYLGTAASVAETFTLTATSSTSFNVVGSVSGALAAATVGSDYTSAKIAFKIVAGATPFVAGDVFTINTSPAWTRLAKWGCPDTRKWTSNLSGVQNLLVADSAIATAATTATYVEWEMVTATKVRRIFARASATPTRMPTSLSLQWKDNVGDAWTTAQTFTKSSWASGEGAIFQTSSDAGAHKYWRLDMSGATSSTEIDAITLYRDTTGPILSSAQAEWAWQAPGLDGSKTIPCHARTIHSQSADTYNVAFNVSRSFDATQDMTAQPAGAGGTTMSLGASAMAYWFVVNGQRAIVVTRFSSIYQIAYIGFGLPYEPPSVHQFPAICAASSDGFNTRRYDSTSARYRFPIDPGPNTVRAYYPDATWRNHSNRSDGSSGTEGAYDNTAEGKVWPASYSGTTAPLSFLRDNIDGSRSLIPCVLSMIVAPFHGWGEFDGLFWATGYATVSEATIRQEGFDHLVVQNIFRNGTKDFGAVRLD